MNPSPHPGRKWIVRDYLSLIRQLFAEEEKEAPAKAGTPTAGVPPLGGFSLVLQTRENRLKPELQLKTEN